MTIRIEPIITEKSSLLSQDKQYIFKVSGDANKIELAKSIEALTGVKVVKVRMINVGAKERLIGRGRVMTKRKPFKKAIVTTEEAIDLNQLNKEKTNK